MPRSVLLLLSAYFLASVVSAAHDPEDCLPEFCPGPDCRDMYREECQYWIDLHGEPYFLQHKTNCSRFWLCEPSDFNGINLCEFECAPCAPWPEVTPSCPDHALEFDWTINYPLGPVCNFPALINCTNKACPLPCQVPDENGVCHPECCVDADCRGDTPICDQDTHTCVPGCRLDSDCDNWNGICPTCQWCNKPDNADTGKCEPGCLTDDQCKDPTPVCQDHQCKPLPCEYPCCNQHTDCHGYDTLCDIPPWNTDPKCEYCNSIGNNSGTCIPGCIDSHDKCPDGFTCDGDHKCLPDCVPPCCTKSSDCPNHSTTCQIPALSPPDANSPSCEYCTAKDDGTKGQCTPGCDPKYNMCPSDHATCGSDHECNNPGQSIIQKIHITTKECKGCSNQPQEGGAKLEIIGSTQCQDLHPPCICNTNGLDHTARAGDYNAGNTVTFTSGVLEDLTAMGECYQALVRTGKVMISWVGPDASQWSPQTIVIEDNEGYTKTCTPSSGTTLNNQDAPIEVACIQ